MRSLQNFFFSGLNNLDSLSLHKGAAPTFQSSLWSSSSQSTCHDSYDAAWGLIIFQAVIMHCQIKFKFSSMNRASSFSSGLFSIHSFPILYSRLEFPQLRCRKVWLSVMVHNSLHMIDYFITNLKRSGWEKMDIKNYFENTWKMYFLNSFSFHLHGKKVKHQKGVIAVVKEIWFSLLMLTHNKLSSKTSALPLKF